MTDKNWFFSLKPCQKRIIHEARLTEMHECIQYSCDYKRKGIKVEIPTGDITGRFNSDEYFKDIVSEMCKSCLDEYDGTQKCSKCGQITNPQKFLI